MRRAPRPSRWALSLPVLVAALLVGIILPAAAAAAKQPSPNPTATSVEMTMAVHPTAVDTATMVRLMISQTGGGTAHATAGVTGARTRLVPPGLAAFHEPSPGAQLRAGRGNVHAGRGPPARA